MMPLSCLTKFALLFAVTGVFRVAWGDVLFGVVGDVPYGNAALARFPELTSSIEASDIEFLIHVGDIKGGSAPCTNEMLSRRIDAINAIDRAVVFIPGDNDWTDCHRRRAGGYQPLERLSLLRTLAFPSVGRSLGRQAMDVQSQASIPGQEEFPEHQYWTQQGVSFTTLHVLGSDNGLARFKGRSQADDDEALRRIAASISWLKTSFAAALESHSDALVIAVHGNPFGMSERRANRYPVRPYEELLKTIREGAAQFSKPVLLIHGDTHDYKFDQPFKDTSNKTIENIYRLEGIGSPAMGWVEVSVGMSMEVPFRVTPNFISR